MNESIKMVIKWRSEIIDDIEHIEFNRIILDGEHDKVESFQRDPWEGLTTAVSIIHKVFPRGREFWVTEPLPHDDEWEEQILVYHASGKVTQTANIIQVTPSPPLEEPKEGLEFTWPSGKKEKL